MSKFLIVTCAALGVFLSGCTALVVGGAAAGGYAIGKDDRNVGTIVDDGTITASVKTKLIADKYVKAFAIDVDTYESVVTLTGTVTSYIARSQAEKLAGEVEGVSSVVNNIQVAVDP